MVLHTFSLNIGEAEGGGSGLYSEFQSSKGYMVRPCLKKKAIFCSECYDVIFLILRPIRKGEPSDHKQF